MVKATVLKKATKTLQNRLTGAFIFTTFTISILYGFLVLNAMKYTEDDILNRRLLLEAEYFIDQYKSDPSIARLPNAIGLKSYLSSSSDLPELLRQQPLGTRELHDEELHVGVIEIPESDELLYLSLSEFDASNLENDLSSLFLVLIAVGALITTLGLIIGLILSGYIAKPIIQLTLDVEQNDLNKKTPFYGGSRDDEVGALSRAFTKLFGRLHLFLEREKEFTRYASHELRTPISLIRNSIALLRLPNQGDDSRERNLGRIESAAIDLESLVDTFLTLGREGNAMKDHINVIDMLKNNLERNALVNQTKKLDVKLEIKETPEKIRASKKLVDILIDNIVRNIYTHGASDAKIVVHGDRIIFKNSYVDREEIVTEERRESYGMEIVAKIAEKCGFELLSIVNDGSYFIALKFS